jgi:murein DD-endopeptidase MepM/ murein hydrolase activator NlpD
MLPELSGLRQARRPLGIPSLHLVTGPRNAPQINAERAGYDGPMRALLKFLVFLIIAAVIVAGGAWVWAEGQPGPTITIRQPEKFIGQMSTLEMSVEAPRGQFSRIDVSVEQNGKTFPVFALGQPEADVKQDSAERIYIMRPVGKRAIPELQTGNARILVSAARPVLYGMRQAESTATRDVQVRLDPPRAGVLSSHHYVNHGGAEFVIYRATPADVESGVRVGERTYPGYPGTAVGLTDPAVRVAFFALLYDQELNERVELFARDPAGNQVAVELPDYRAFPKPFARSLIQIDDRFLQRVVPAIAQNTPTMQIDTNDLLRGFLSINGELRRKNAETIAALSQKSAPEMMWKDNFQQLGNSQVEARFADHRTYVYQGKEVDQQVHLGFDLAVTSNVPIVAAQRGVVVYADYLGIYGNCVIVDHGLGVQTLYAHLSSIDVKTGDRVEKGQTLGRSGMTGLAGGDHLHFTTLVNGQAVNPVEWWDTKWMQDRVFRKITEAGGPTSTTATP